MRWPTSSIPATLALPRSRNLRACCCSLMAEDGFHQLFSQLNSSLASSVRIGPMTTQRLVVRPYLCSSTALVSGKTNAGHRRHTVAEARYMRMGVPRVSFIPLKGSPCP